MKKLHIVIVGGGVGGIVQARWLLATLKPPYKITLLEEYDTYGGVWDVSREYGVMEFTECNVSKYVMQLAGYPWPDGTPLFPHQTQVLRYIRCYAEHFLKKQPNFLAHFNCKVVKIIKNNVDVIKTGFWTVTYYNKSSSEYYSISVSHLIIANGHCQIPHYPVHNIDKFEGFISHSCTYKSCKINGFLNKKILVVGLSFSAVDVAVDLVDMGQNQVTVLTRSGSWFGKKAEKGVPSDMFLPRMFLHLPYSIQRFLLRIVLNFKYFNQNNWQISNRTDPTGGNLVVSQRFVDLVKSNDIKIIHGSILTVNDDKSILLSDNSKLQIFDNIIFCTGYKPSFDFFSETEHISDIISDKTYHSKLYLNMILPELGSKLSFIGLFNTKFTSPFQIIDLQGRYIAKLIAGDIFLPNKAAMQKCISEHIDYLTQHCNAFRASLFLASDYRDTLASLLGCIPKISIFTSPKRWIMYNFGGITWAGYSLNDKELKEQAELSLSQDCDMKWGKYWFLKGMTIFVLIVSILLPICLVMLKY